MKTYYMQIDDSKTKWDCTGQCHSILKELGSKGKVGYIYKREVEGLQGPCNIALIIIIKSYKNISDARIHDLFDNSSQALCKAIPFYFMLM